MNPNASEVEITWALVALVGLVATAWLTQVDWSYFATVRQAADEGIVVPWGPRWWIALAFLVANVLFFVVWLGFAILGFVAMTVAPSRTEVGQETSTLLGWLLVTLEIVLASIQFWWRYVRWKLRSVVAPVPDRRLTEAAQQGRPMIHQINNDLALCVGLIDLILESGALPPEQQAELDLVIEKLQLAVDQMTELQALVRGLDPFDTSPPSSAAGVTTPEDRS